MPPRSSTARVKRRYGGRHRSGLAAGGASERQRHFVHGGFCAMRESALDAVQRRTCSRVADRTADQLVWADWPAVATPAPVKRGTCGSSEGRGAGTPIRPHRLYGFARRVLVGTGHGARARSSFPTFPGPTSSPQQSTSSSRSAEASMALSLRMLRSMLRSNALPSSRIV